MSHIRTLILGIIANKIDPTLATIRREIRDEDARAFYETLDELVQSGTVVKTEDLRYELAPLAESD